MKRIDEVCAVGSCLNRAHDDEMIFVLLARDEAASATVRFWIRERIRLGRNALGDAQIVEAQQIADEMDAQRDE